MVLFVFVFLNLVGSFLWITYLLACTLKTNIYISRLVFVLSWMTINIIFLVVTLVLFIYAAYKKHRSAYLDYRLNLFL